MDTINGCTIVPPSDGTELVSLGAAETGGAYVVTVGALAAGQPGPPMHAHPETDEMFYVADGEATFQLGDRQIRALPGTLVLVPRGVPHTAWNSGTEPLRGLIVVSPGGAEHRFDPVDGA